MTPFKRIALVANVELAEIDNLLNRLCCFLDKGGYSVLSEKRTSYLIDSKNIPIFDHLHKSLNLVLIIV